MPLDSLGAALDAVANTLRFLAREGVLLLLTFVPLAILAGLGKEMGLPSLFWRITPEEPGRRRKTRATVGFSLGVLLATEMLVLLLVESAVKRVSPEAFAWRLRVCTVVACLAVFVIALWRPYGGEDQSRRSHDRKNRRVTALWLPLTASIGAATFVWVALRAHLLMPERWATWLRPRLWPAAHDLGRYHEATTILLLLGLVLYVALAVGRRLFDWRLYAGAVICILLCVLAALHGFVAFRLPGAQIPLYLLLATLYALLGSSWQRARVPLLELQPAPAATPLLDDHRVLEAWKAQQRAEEKPLLVVVAADGGGIRSGLWTGTVLTTLETASPRFANSVRLITGASGGMLGAGLWAATQSPKATGGLEHVTTAGTPLPADKLLDALQQGGLSAIATGLVFRDLLPPPFRFGPDRGRALEAAWERNCDAMTLSFDRLATGEKDGWRSSLVLMPMVVEDGRRLVISNLDLSALLHNEGPIGGQVQPYSKGGVQLFEALPHARTALPLSTAVRLQANFPWVLPATEIPPLGPGLPRTRVVDAGYYDETGVDMACLWIARHADWLRENTSGLMLIQNRDSAGIDRTQLPSGSRGVLSRGFDGLLTPVSAVMRARDSTTWFRNDGTVEWLARLLNGSRPGSFFTTFVFELGFPASLSWSLTDDEAAAIRDAMKSPKNIAVLNDLLEWARARDSW